ncbi:MAG TPA: YciI family protein [Gaiellaceae bacterium]|nr:YciI family protein [Gaiellaceae bacterium]
MGVVQFEQYSIVLLTTPASPPTFTDAERARLQDAHLSYLATLHDQGHLLAVGPLSDPGGELRGLSILNVDAARARELKEADEAVGAGVFDVRAIPWSVPAGAMTFSHTRLPRSMKDVRG